MTTPPGGYDPNQPYGNQPPPPGGYGAPPQDHPKATTALILGIVGLACCQILGPFAWMTGKKAVSEIDASGGRLGGRGKAQAGYILGIIATVILILWVLFLILAAVTGGISFEAGTSTS